MQQYNIGDVVQVQQSLFNEPYGVYTIVYDVYADYADDTKQGICLMSVNGFDMGGFSAAEQEEYIVFKYHTQLRYTFKSAMQLAADENTGMFRRYFK